MHSKISRFFCLASIGICRQTITGRDWPLIFVLTMDYLELDYAFNFPREPDAGRTGTRLTFSASLASHFSTHCEPILGDCSQLLPAQLLHNLAFTIK